MRLLLSYWWNLPDLLKKSCAVLRKQTAQNKLAQEEVDLKKRVTKP